MSGASIRSTKGSGELTLSGTQSNLVRGASTMILNEQDFFLKLDFFYNIEDALDHVR